MEATVSSARVLIADSRPEAEHQECVNKARAVLSAVEMAGRGKAAS
jgi:anthranilate/para-aminobenzoate synthase component I